MVVEAGRDDKGYGTGRVQRQRVKYVVHINYTLTVTMYSEVDTTSSLTARNPYINTYNTVQYSTVQTPLQYIYPAANTFN